MFWHDGRTVGEPVTQVERGEAPVYPGASIRLWPIPGSAEGLVGRVIEVGPESAGGEGAVTVVFLHGLVGLNDHWEGVVQRIRGEVWCTLFELPLLRFSGEMCSIEGVTDLTVRFLRERVRGPAVLVGNSFGGHVALRIAIDQPDLVRGLVLSGSGGLVERTLVSDIQLRPTRPWLRTKIAELFFDESNMRESDVDRALAELQARGGARAMVRLARSARKDELRGCIERVKAPTLLIWGKQDVVTPPEAAEGFHRLIPGSRLVWLDRCGHAPMIEQPARFAEEMLTLTREIAGA